MHETTSSSSSEELVTTPTSNTSNTTTKKANAMKKEKKTKTKQQQTAAVSAAATTAETLSFIFQDNNPNTKALFFVGILSAIGNGLVFPGIAWIFSTSFSEIGAATDNGLEPIAIMCYWFMGIGFYAFVMSTIQTVCFEIVAYQATQTLRLAWFAALLRQDQAFFDVHDIGGIANTVGSLTSKYRRGLGRKLGEGIQFFTCGLGGIVYALYESWKVALVVLSFTPVISFFSICVVQLNQTKSERAATAYSQAGSIAYSTVSGIKTVLSLNAGTKMITQYQTATENALMTSIQTLIKQGFVNGMMLGSFMIMYVILTLYGVYLIYIDVASTGCDPSGGVADNPNCVNAGPNVFGAMLGIAFAAQGIGQVGTFLETFSTSRFACGQALVAIHRQTGRPQEILYYENDDTEDASEDATDTNEDKKSQKNNTTKRAETGEATTSTSSVHGSDSIIETPEGRIKAILPPYEINSMSTDGYTFHSDPKSKSNKSTGIHTTNTNSRADIHVQGEITFRDVEFNYPTRPSHRILNGLSIHIEPGQTIAFVGPSGGGKSTIVKLLERFYDPTVGSIELDGTNLRDINVKHLRGLLGYVGQEPQLFATSIATNIAYGVGDDWMDVTQQQIEDAARLANAHDFISSLPDKYETQVGDKGSQLSGGQKQRIAIARVLVSDPKILLLDEATSALDSQSELVVQEALEHIISTQKCTTLIIAHRLSTIRNADTIAVVSGGLIVETGTHDELISQQDSYYKKLVDTQHESTEVTSFLKRRSTTIIPDNGNNKRSSAGQMAFDTVPVKFHESGAPPLILFRNVSFSYPTRPNKLILDRFKLKVYKGETIGLCGISGGGKSTVMGLIERFYDPSDGSVEYFDTNVKDLNVKWYRDQIGYVGQEPTLFDGTIAENIAYGCDDDSHGKPSVTHEQITEAAKQANAYDFIMNFPDKFETMIDGGSSTQLSGGQKQRVAIARALVKQPEILLLDEATSALDNESESIVQDALEILMESNERTCIVIAHRLSTIRYADRIAFISDGRVKEIGSHEELMEKPKGLYKRLVEAQGRDANSSSLQNSSTKKKTSARSTSDGMDKDTKDGDGNEKDTDVEKEESTAFSLSRACKLATPDAFYLLVGAVGGLLSGSIFPSWGILFGETINLLYRPVFDCTSAFLITLSLSPPYSKYDTCEEYWQAESDLMRNESFKLAWFWGILVLVCVVGGVLSFWGFGNASERLSRRIRDSAFHSLVRQEVAFFDKRSVGKITSELQEDAAMIQTFTGQPIRAFTVAIASVLTGLVISFTFMWPFAFVALASIPLMGFATSLDMKQFMGEDEKQESGDIDASTPSGIVVETLLNMGTVSALTMEEARFKNFKELLNKSDEHYVRDGFHQGGLAGLSQFIQQWITAALFYWGGWLLMQYPDRYDFKDFLISNFAIIFSLFGLGAAFQDMSDRKQMEASASRIFYLLDRVSLIDPLSKEGEILNTSVDRPIRRKSSKKAKRKSTMLPIVEADPVGSSSRTEKSRDDNSSKPKTKKSSSSKKMNEISAIKMTDITNDTENNEDLKNALPKKKKKKKKKDNTRSSSTKLLSTYAATLNDSSTEMHDTTAVDEDQENCDGAVDELNNSKKKKKKKKKKNPTAAMAMAMEEEKE